MVAASILIASETVGGDTTASTVTETPVTLESIAVALLGLLVAIAIVDCTDVAISVSVWMLTSTMTLPDATVRADAVPTDAERAVTSTADGWTPAAAASRRAASGRGRATGPGPGQPGPARLLGLAQKVQAA